MLSVCPRFLARLAHRHDPRGRSLDARGEGDAEANNAPDVAALDREDGEEVELHIGMYGRKKRRVILERKAWGLVAGGTQERRSFGRYIG